MKNSKLFRLLTKFKKSPSKIKSFYKFLRSPYFNTTQDVVTLLDQLIKHWNSKEVDLEYKLSKEKIYKKVYPKEAYSVTKINTCSSRLFSLLENFLLAEELKNNERHRNILLADAYQNIKADELYFKKMKQLLKDKEQKGKIGPTLYLDLAWLNDHIYYHPNQKKKAGIKENIHLINWMKNFDLYCDLKKLQYACEFFTLEKMVSNPKKFPSEINSLRLLIQKDYEENELLDAYADILRLFFSQNEEDIPSVKNKIFTLAKNDKIDCRLDLLVKFINALPAQDKQVSLYFEMYKIAVEQKLLIEHGYIAIENFDNILHLAFAQNEIEWVKVFVANHAKNLELGDDKLGSIKKLHNAYISIHENKFEKAIELLGLIKKIKNVSFSLRFHTLLIRAYVEGRRKLEYMHDFEILCNNFKAYLQRQYKVEINATTKKSCLVYINLSRKIFRWEVKSFDKAKELKKLEITEGVPFKTWLIKMINELK